jgi:hypothetical protein
LLKNVCVGAVALLLEVQPQRELPESPLVVVGTLGIADAQPSPLCSESLKHPPEEIRS